jgi:hypothetical protein
MTGIVIPEPYRNKFFNGLKETALESRELGEKAFISFRRNHNEYNLV